MARIIAVLAFAIPFGAHADFVFVDYWGVVSDVSRTICVCDPTQDNLPGDLEFTGYKVGDSIKGRLKIDLDLAPPDSRTLDPSYGLYVAPADTPGFISGNGRPLINNVHTDMVSVTDVVPFGDRPTDSYGIEDNWSSPNGSGQLALLVYTHRPDVELTSGEGIAQTIDARPTDDVGLFGYLGKVVKTAVGSVAVGVSLALSRVRVSPGRCHA